MSIVWIAVCKSRPPCECLLCPRVPLPSHLISCVWRLAACKVYALCSKHLWLALTSLLLPRPPTSSSPSHLFLRLPCSTLVLLDAFFMVWIAIIFGDNLGIPQSVMGLTVLAMGTSVPDMISSVIVTLHGGTADAPDARR